MQLKLDSVLILKVLQVPQFPFESLIAAVLTTVDSGHYEFPESYYYYLPQGISSGMIVGIYGTGAKHEPTLS